MKMKIWKIRIGWRSAPHERGVQRHEAGGHFIWCPGDNWHSAIEAVIRMREVPEDRICDITCELDGQED